MAIDVERSNHYFKVKGALDKHSITEFKRYLSGVFETSTPITICIEDVVSIDQHGVNALTELYRESIEKQKTISIVGSGCKELYQHFRTQNIQALVS
ncbi:STAS domain-containing protein [Psychroserpens sp.]|uniref:STAS domain-containing protein n=1 Tax=Psychroserpens sp. TaxID=2020870 RepID=UPI003C74E73A